MNKKHIAIIISVLFLIVLFGIGRSHLFQQNKTSSVDRITHKKIKSTTVKTDSLPIGLIKLKNAYPDFIDSINDNYLIWKDGTKMMYDDGIKKPNFDTLLNNADLHDQMQQEYPEGEVYKIPHKNFDPGRIRNEAFFKKMYGSTKKKVRNNLVTIQWLPQTVNKPLQITCINGVDKKLTAISEELEKHPQFDKYLANPAGAFYWRFIADTKRLSMHSFGIAVDINVKYSNYWKWSRKQTADSIPYKNRIPLDIVEIFEKHGFIWGGKWYHYDTMHFEYRPELLK